jgi:hypothetical protein
MWWRNEFQGISFLLYCYSSVTKVTVCGLDDQCWIPERVRDFFYVTPYLTVLGLVGTEEAGCLEYDINHTPPFNAEIKNVWGFISVPQFIFTSAVWNRDTCLYIEENAAVIYFVNLL